MKPRRTRLLKRKKRRRKTWASRSTMLRLMLTSTSGRGDSQRIKAIRANDSKALYDLEDTEAEDPTAAWKDAVVEGKGFLCPSCPVDDLQLEWAHGYSGQNMRGNARYASTGEVVYPAASLGLVLDKTPVAERMVRSQKVMANHAGQITAMTSHGDMCATAANASVLVWSSADVVVSKAFHCYTMAARPWPSRWDGNT